ncbi:MAG TPA: hypothetical protein VF365_05305 [Candidatus Limnocylindria bacterium]
MAHNACPQASVRKVREAKDESVDDSVAGLPDDRCAVLRSPGEAEGGKPT